MVTDDVAPAATPVRSAVAATRTRTTRQTPVFKVNLLRIAGLATARGSASVRGALNAPRGFLESENQTSASVLLRSIKPSVAPTAVVASAPAAFASRAERSS